MHVKPSRELNHNLSPLLSCCNAGSRTLRRPVSTAQASRVSTDHNIPPALLFKERHHRPSKIPMDSPSNAKGSSGKGQGPTHPRPEPSQAQPRSPNTKAQGSAPRVNRWSGRGRTAMKRKRAASLEQLAKRRNVTSSTSMKDLAHSMHLPSPQECPGLSQDLSRRMLENPKEVVYNMIHNPGLGRLYCTTASKSRGHLISCTLSCKLESHHEELRVEGEAPTKVRSTYAILRAC